MVSDDGLYSGFIQMLKIESTIVKSTSYYHRQKFRSSRDFSRLMFQYLNIAQFQISCMLSK